VRRFAGIDVGSETHVVAIVDREEAVLLKPTPFAEDGAGYARLFELLGDIADILVAMEATGHYSRNLFAALTRRGYRVAVVNAIRTRRFAEEELARAKTDAIDALGIARFAAQRRPLVTPGLDEAAEELRELVALHGRLTQDHGDRVRQLHRLTDLCFPEFTRHVRTLDSQLATAILYEYPAAKAFDDSSPKRLARLRYDGRHWVGAELAGNLIAAAKASAAQHHGPIYAAEVRFICDDLAVLRGRLQSLAAEIAARVARHPVASLLSTIDGLGPLSVARIVATVGDPARFRHAAAFASYVGVVPRTNRSGLRRPSRFSLTPLGSARLRSALYMATLGAVRTNPWLRAFYTRLRGRGKLPKVALIAAERKLLTAVYYVAKSRRPFVPKLTTTERE
jgi:transposase